MPDLTFAQLDEHFRKDNFPIIEKDPRGIRFFKLRAMSRKTEMEEFCNKHGICLEGIEAKDYFSHIFELEQITDVQIDEFFNLKYEEERAERKEKEDYLVDQLSRLPNFDWGGSFGNKLEKNIVDNYVKKIQSFDQINEEINNSLLASLKGYTLCSWYNHWTSIIIEDLFKDHPTVLPTIGLVKKIDFFINNIPFDLKVTYFPQELLDDKLKIEGYKKEIDALTAKCQELGIDIPLKHEDGDRRKLLSSLLEEYRKEITKFVKANRKNAIELGRKCAELGIALPDNLPEIELRKRQLFALRKYRDDIEAFTRSVKYESELSKLKTKCEELTISIPEDLKDKRLEQHLYNKLSEDQRPIAKEFIRDLNENRRKIITEAEVYPTELKKWLYENQGESRFDASNRFFLVLTDESNIYNSWKLKRNIIFLKEKIHEHLDNLSFEDMSALETEFYWKEDQKTYICKSDILFLKYPAE